MTVEDQLRLRLKQDFANPNVMEVQDVIVKSGPQAYKTAALLTIGDKATGDVKKRSSVKVTVPGLPVSTPAACR